MRGRHTGDDVPRPPIDVVLAELVGHEVQVPTGYGWLRFSCPFHEDRTPSASVNHDVNGFNCHSCQRQGDMVKLLERELRLSTREAMAKARELAGEQPQASRPAKKRRPSDLLKRGE